MQRVITIENDMSKEEERPVSSISWTRSDVPVDAFGRPALYKIREEERKTKIKKGRTKK